MRVRRLASQAGHTKPCWGLGEEDLLKNKGFRVEASFIIESSPEDSATCLLLPKLCGGHKLLSRSLSLRLSLSPVPPQGRHTQIRHRRFRRWSYPQAFMTQNPAGNRYLVWTFYVLNLLLWASIIMRVVTFNFFASGCWTVCRKSLSCKCGSIIENRVSVHTH